MQRDNSGFYAVDKNGDEEVHFKRAAHAGDGISESFRAGEQGVKRAGRANKSNRGE